MQIANYLKPRSCKRRVTLAEAPRTKDTHSLWTLLEATTTAHDHPTLCCLPCTSTRCKKNLQHNLLASHLLNWRTLLTCNGSDTGRQPLLHGVVWQPSSRSMGRRAASSNVLKYPNYMHWGDLRCSPELAQQLLLVKAHFLVCKYGKWEYFGWNLAPTKNGKLCNPLSPRAAFCPCLLRQHEVKDSSLHFTEAGIQILEAINREKGFTFSYLH